ncbi:DUF2182 domain-containing protein [Sinorhizobium chiapasense]|uniref:DUF2182 domain-containing protein n=1 Tax=Sinorhizobium chiapasense TaxID=501572 RepID=A0ABZ2BDU3_9HYPH
MSIDAAVESALKRDRIVFLAALSIVIVIAWTYVLAGAGMNVSGLETICATPGRAGIPMMMPAVWDMSHAALMFIMWWVMMIAMMLPSAAPAVLLFGAMSRRQKEKGNPFVPTSLFASAYLIAWAGFSIVAVGLQWGLEHSALLSPMLDSASATLDGTLLLLAGIYQLTPLKRACLRQCRSPLQFILTHWRGGTIGAFRMGIEQGASCVACCWFLMGLLFFGGVMNLYWMVGLTTFVLLEKVLPMGSRLGNLVGVALIVWGAAKLVEEMSLRFLELV